MSRRSFERDGLFVRFSLGAFFCYSASVLMVWSLCGLVFSFRQQNDPPTRAAPTPGVPASVETLVSVGSVGVPGFRLWEGGVPIRVSSEPHPFTSSIDGDFYQTIIRKNLFAPLGTVFSAEPEPGRHLTLVGTFVSEDPSASSVLIKDTTTGRHHLLSVGEGVGDFHVLAVDPKAVRFYHHGTEVKRHLSESENLFLNTNRR